MRQELRVKSKYMFLRIRACSLLLVGVSVKLAVNFCAFTTSLNVLPERIHLVPYHVFKVTFLASL